MTKGIVLAAALLACAASVAAKQGGTTTGGTTTGGGYSLRTVGTCKTGMSFLDSASACEHAAGALGLADKTAGGCTGCTNNPHGCYFKLSTRSLYYNVGGDRADTDTDRVSLCKIPIQTDIESTCTGSHLACKRAAQIKSQPRCASYSRFGCTWGPGGTTTGGTTTGVPKCALVTGASVEGMDALWKAARPACFYSNCSQPSQCSPASTRFKLLQSYMGLNIDGATHRIKDISKLCGGLMENLEHTRPVCGALFTNEDNTPTLVCGASQAGGSGIPILVKYPINCAATKHGYADKIGLDGKAFTATDLQAVLDICTTPCMQDLTRTQQCCMVPPQIAHLFQCCRKGGCCADQQRRRTQATRDGRREAQVSVGFSVTVTVNSASASPYDALLRCLQNPAKTDAMCSTGSSGH